MLVVTLKHCGNIFYSVSVSLECEFYYLFFSTPVRCQKTPKLNKFGVKGKTTIFTLKTHVVGSAVPDGRLSLLLVNKIPPENI